MKFKSGLPRSRIWFSEIVSVLGFETVLTGIRQRLEERLGLFGPFLRPARASADFMLSQKHEAGRIY
jgi:hypothetical protein